MRLVSVRSSHSPFALGCVHSGLTCNNVGVRIELTSKGQVKNIYFYVKNVFLKPKLFYSFDLVFQKKILD